MARIGPFNCMTDDPQRNVAHAMREPVPPDEIRAWCGLVFKPIGHWSVGIWGHGPECECAPPEEWPHCQPCEEALPTASNSTGAYREFREQLTKQG